MGIVRNNLNPAFKAMTDGLYAAADESRAVAARRLASLRRSNRQVLTGTFIAFGVGLMLVAAFWSILRSSRRREERASREEMVRLERQALTDSLTGLGNHRAFQEDLAAALAAQDGDPLSLVKLDLDHLKEINNSRGHQAGDEQLKAVAHELRRTTPESGRAYRVGGDEFAAILHQHGAWDAFRYLQALLGALEQVTTRPVPRVTAGLSEADATQDKDELIHEADLALIEAKRGHRGVVAYTPELEPEPDDPDPGAEKRRLQTITAALARAVDARDSYTRSHCETVSELCALMGRELGLPAPRIAKLRFAGLLHDVGKIGISDAILHKPSELTIEEFETMKSHAGLGHRIVQAAELVEEAEWILHHHERIDGRGYPDGLEGSEIALEARIILVADAFEAMTSDRPYRRAQPDGAALEELERDSGTQFDADCVRALKRVLGGESSPRPGEHGRPAAQRA
jgi:diguanylate cyclase (GGDEF)-like protein